MLEAGRRYDRPREGNYRRDDDRSPERDRKPPPAKLRVDNLHYDLTEEDIWDLFGRIAPVKEARLRYDRAGRSEGIAFVTYDRVADARAAIREFDGANAKGQPIHLTLLPLPRRDNPFDRVENPKSLFDRIEPPASRSRRRSESPMEELDEERRNRRAPRRGGGPRDRRSDTTKPAPENIDRYVPGSRDSRSSSHRGGRRPGERRERTGRDGEGHKLVNGRPRKTAEELDAEMDDYWGHANPHEEASDNAVPVAQEAQPAAGDDIDMIE
ncbi:uncharacterized protein Z520_09948 [Fonsecaea multimorphosa CBS 102226]|uniref:RRM domain-containing protein n=1 Tax=Fonsecaea multimorphosa CBS 102226 TaxID=1442371 RepID=A0A0D2KC04_9EURO|nr:uncharacterized protein Z520_09948 [Fonsecaea multimorphosa CBS 102226]KIX94238.1 hypothetical protein Z520_09948 [Fonsecaea multimorphosa CBS 102226]